MDKNTKVMPDFHAWADHIVRKAMFEPEGLSHIIEEGLTCAFEQGQTYDWYNHVDADQEYIETVLNILGRSE